ncbi:uncharacterized protein EV420DRAFT_1050022 [Desarmillaria tabescens]|uniref:Uncharacterized protein n=1 Tax=Armillaria tabescens TaxID=1929756 RepID=A0AA39NFA1_ARMTA|nr:uncharacterized protein EV420DRAFT_1050022 [Desarmillaria tabescens]KAK0464555.1 hypothetical protein EV420DRAFT_1050022 [Desarmillaria tabescens]
MPSLVYSSRIKAVDDHTSVVLLSKHCLVLGEPSDIVYIVKQAHIPDNVDILLASSLTFTISGLLDKKKVSADCIQRSHLARHIVEYLKNNAAVLGLSTISDVYRGDNDDVPTFTVHSSRYMPSSSEIKSTHLTLTAIHLRYEWRNNTTLDSSSQLHPFSTNLPLPFLTLLDNLIGRFATWHLVKRYPLIFGTWFKQLDIEALFFPKIFRMLLDMMKRSPNPEFRSTCKRLLKSIRRKQLSKISSSNASLSKLLPEVGRDLDTFKDCEKELEFNVEDAFCLAMDHCYRRVIRRPAFKSVNRLFAASADAGDDDELALDQVPLLQTALESLRGLDILSNFHMPTTFVPLDPDHTVSVHFSDDGSSDAALVDIDLEGHDSNVDLDSQSDDNLVDSDFSFEEELSSPATSSRPILHQAEACYTIEDMMRSASPYEQENLSSLWHSDIEPPDAVRHYSFCLSTGLEHLMDMDSDTDESGFDSLSPVSQDDASLFDTRVPSHSGFELAKPNFVPPISPAQEPLHLEDLDCLMFFDKYDLDPSADDSVAITFDTDVGISLDLDTDDHAPSHCSTAHVDSDEEVLVDDCEDMVIDHIDCQLEDSSEDEVAMVEIVGLEMFEILDDDWER